MIPLADFHVHSTFSDGKDEPEAIVKAALQMGLTELGFSDHSYTAFDESYCIQKERIEEYRAEIARLKEVYADRIRIHCGIEQDCYSETGTEDYDYVIGSVHYLSLGGAYVPVDETPEILLKAAESEFGGDLTALAECYFDTVSRVVERTGAGVIGHFDLITKFNEGDRLFDSRDVRYRRAWQTAADMLLKTGSLFEINFGAMSRGYRREPYPSPEIIAYLRARGARFLLSSDSHQKETLCYGFREFDSSGLNIGTPVKA